MLLKPYLPGDLLEIFFIESSYGQPKGQYRPQQHDAYREQETGAAGKEIFVQCTGDAN